MNKKKLFYVVTATLGLVTVSLLIINNSEDKTVPRKLENYSVTDDGTKYTVKPSKLIMGCSGKDCIPSIDNPKFVEKDNAEWLNENDMILGVEINNSSKAYPLRILNVHEIVNDELSGEPIVVTYCPLCRSGLVYSREVDGERLEFGVSGRLYNANLVMYDRNTSTFWSQIHGEAIVGEKVPTELELISSSITEWENWKKGHPETMVLSRDTGIYPESTYSGNPYASYESSERVGYGVNKVDDRLPSKDIVYGVSIGTDSVAYPETVIRDENIIQDRISGTPILVVENQETNEIKVFSREYKSEELEFTLRNNKLVDQEGREWSMNGESISGSKSLDQLNANGFFWFAWSKFHPETEVYR